MDLLKQLLVYVFVIAVLYAGIALMPRLSRVQMPFDYTEIDIPHVEDYKSYSLDKRATVAMLRQGDAVCYQVSRGESAASNGFGWVVGVPGDRVQFSKGEVLVNEKATKLSGPVHLPDAGPIVVPENHVYVVTNLHQTDSVARGPLPADALRGRVGDFP
jgi:hypothetical protein